MKTLVVIAFSLIFPVTTALAAAQSDQPATWNGRQHRAAASQKRGNIRHSYKRCMEIGLERGVSPNLKATWCMMHGYNQ